MVNLSEYWSGEEYDCQYEHLYQHNVSFIGRQIISTGAQRLLDVCCGTGLVALPLTRFVGWVTGIELNKPMLNHACYKAQDVNNIEFIRADAQSYRLALRYDIAVLTSYAFQSFLSDDEVRDVLGNIARHLNKGGRLVFDVRLPSRHNVSESRIFDFGGIYVSAAGERVNYFSKRERYDSHREVLYFRKRRIYPNGDIYESTSELRFRPKQLILALLDEAGFDIVSLHRNWNGDLLKNSSSRMICVARYRGDT